MRCFLLQLSISEYRRRHSMVSNSSTEQDTSCGSISPGAHQNSSSVATPAPISRTASTSDDFGSDILPNTGSSNALESFNPLNSDRGMYKQNSNHFYLSTFNIPLQQNIIF